MGTHPESVEVALLTVGIDKEISRALCTACAGMPWSLVPLEFDYYFSKSKRPYFTQRALNAHACSAVIDFDNDIEGALETARLLRQSFYSKMEIIALSSSANPDLLVRAMRAGCSEFLSKPLDQDSLSDLVLRMGERWSSSGRERPRNRGKILSFFGAKGGVGTTTLAVHLGVSLTTACKKKVLLIDNHMRLGHVCLYLGMDSTHYHFHELVRNVSRLDQELLLGFIAKHSSGLDVLSSPDVHCDVGIGDVDAVGRTLEFLTSQYDFVLLDCETAFQDVHLHIIDVSHEVYLVATPEIGALRDLSRYVDGLVQNEQAINKLRVVVNRFSSREALQSDQIERAIRMPVAVKIANNYGELVRAINAGSPVALDSKAEFALQVKQWADALALTTDAKTTKPARRFRGLWK